MASSADTGATSRVPHDLDGRQRPGHQPQTHRPAEEQHRDHRPGRDAGPEERRLGAVGRTDAEGEEDVEAHPGRRDRGRHQPRATVLPPVQREDQAEQQHRQRELTGQCGGRGGEGRDPGPVLLPAPVRQGQQRHGPELDQHPGLDAARAARVPAGHQEEEGDREHGVGPAGAAGEQRARADHHDHRERGQEQARRHPAEHLEEVGQPVRAGAAQPHAPVDPEGVPHRGVVALPAPHAAERLEVAEVVDVGELPARHQQEVGGGHRRRQSGGDPPGRVPFHRSPSAEPAPG